MFAWRITNMTKPKFERKEVLPMLRHAKGICKTINELGYEAYVVGGALRTMMFGGYTSDVDIAVLCNVGDVDKIRSRSLRLSQFEVQHDREYSSADGFLADYRSGDFNIIFYDLTVYPNVESLLGRFDLNINMLYMGCNDSSINSFTPEIIKATQNVDYYHDVLTVMFNPLRQDEFYRERSTKRIERFKNSGMKGLDWSVIESQML